MGLFLGSQLISPAELVKESGSEKYALFDRVTDDLGNEIGTVCGFFTDNITGITARTGAIVNYAVVCLDAQYRGTGSYSSSYGIVTDLPSLSSNQIDFLDHTATFNTQKILDWCNSNGYTTGCTLCRSRSFTIKGITYYGQFPNINEIFDIYNRRIELNNLDTSVDRTYEIPQDDGYFVSSTQESSMGAWYIDGTNPTLSNTAKTPAYLMFPVLEIPLS